MLDEVRVPTHLSGLLERARDLACEDGVDPERAATALCHLAHLHLSPDLAKADPGPLLLAVTSGEPVTDTTIESDDLLVVLGQVESVTGATSRP